MSVKKSYVAEFLGTFFLLFFGAGSAVTNQETNGAITHLGICLVFGAVVTAIIYTIGDISGSHINPAMTVAFGYLGLFPKKQILPYVISQILGALAAAETLHLLFPNNVGLGGTYPSGSGLQTFILELVLTFFLFFVVVQCSQGTKETQMLAGFIIGLTVFLGATFSGAVEGASMNPARSIGPAIVSGKIENLWIYIVAPIGGALLAAVSYQYFKCDEAKDD